MKFLKSTISRRQRSDERDFKQRSPSEANILAETNGKMVSVKTAGESSITKADSSNWSPSVHTLLDEPPASFPQRMIVGAVVFCLAFGSWAWFGKIEEVSNAQGELVPQGETYKVEPTEIGKVNRIAVEEGQEVQAGQILLEFDTELVRQEVGRLQQMIQAYRTELTQKQTLLEKLVLEAKSSAAMAQAEFSAQQSAIALAQEKVITLRRLLQQQQTEATAYQNKQARLQPISNLSQEQHSQLEAELQARQERLARLKPLAEQGAISQEYVFQAEQSLLETEKQITQSQVQEITHAAEQIFQADQSMRELEARITSNQGELAAAVKDVERLQAELVRKQAEAERTQLEAQQKIKQLELELAQVESKIGDTQNLLATAQTKLKQKSLKAPIDGIVYALNIDNPGRVLEPGETVLEIAPHGVPLVLSAMIPIQKTGFIREGMPVQIKLDAYPYQDYGMISGTINSISVDAKSHRELGAVYQLEVALERRYITDNQQRIDFKPGQTATADIIIRRRRIIDVWLEPIRKLQQDGIKM